MPQLDKVSYFTQLFYFIIVFGITIVFVNYFVIPSIFKNLKFRYYLIKELQNSTESIENKKNSILSNLDSDILTYTKKLNTYLTNNIITDNSGLIELYNKNIVDTRKIVTDRLDSYKYNHQLFNLRKGCI